LDSLRAFLLWLATPGVERDVVAVLVGLCVGSFLNVLALRTLAERPMVETLFGRSECPKCKHVLGVGELIPVLSFLLQNGKCANCKQSISWHYPAVEMVTALAFVVVLHRFQLASDHIRDSSNIMMAASMEIGMIFFFCILIAVCVTDFKEKLIPHEITYPSIIIGIIFSAFIREDLMPSLAGVGISYVLFDFLAFYGLKLYYHSHGDDKSEEEIDCAARANDRDTLANCPDGKSDRAKAEKEDKADEECYDKSQRVESKPEPHWIQARELFAAVRKNGSSAHAIDDTNAPSRSQAVEAAAIAATTTAARTDSVAEELERTATASAISDSASEPIKQKQSDTISTTHRPDTKTNNAHANGDDRRDPYKDDNEDEAEDYDPQIDAAFSIERDTPEEEEFEVMGGGDAVLAGLIAAWIGLENLGITLLFGFLIGSLMGSGYVAVELYRRNSLGPALKRTGLITLVLVLLAESTVAVYAYMTGYFGPGHTQELMQLPWATLAGASAFGGILIGTIAAGSDASKPFPFGPALAIGAMIAVFMDPAGRLHAGEGVGNLAKALFP
jgi:prepilin signal peptidase PulO-like enzyme (type II secretory pathway)